MKQKGITQNHLNNCHHFRFFFGGAGASLGSFLVGDFESTFGAALDFSAVLGLSGSSGFKGKLKHH